MRFDGTDGPIRTIIGVRDPGNLREIKFEPTLSTWQPGGSNDVGLDFLQDPVGISWGITGHFLLSGHSEGGADKTLTFKSRNGSTWALQPSPADGTFRGLINSAAFGSGVWIISFGAGLWRSEDFGKTWQFVFGAASGSASLAYGKPKNSNKPLFVAVGGDSPTNFSSSDGGKTWIAGSNFPLTVEDLEGVRFLKDAFYVPTNNRPTSDTETVFPKILRSTDGSSWGATPMFTGLPMNSPAPGGFSAPAAVTDVAYVKTKDKNDLYVAVGFNTGSDYYGRPVFCSATSNNGISWSAGTNKNGFASSPFPFGNIIRAAGGKNVIVCAAMSCAGTPNPPPTGHLPDGSILGGPVSGVFLTTSDGFSWDTFQPFSPEDIGGASQSQDGFGVIAFGPLFVGVGVRADASSGFNYKIHIWTSKEGLNWHEESFKFNDAAENYPSGIWTGKLSF